jgi:hypothetical protein
MKQDKWLAAIAASLHLIALFNCNIELFAALTAAIGTLIALTE